MEGEVVVVGGDVVLCGSMDACVNTIPIHSHLVSRRSNLDQGHSRTNRPKISKINTLIFHTNLKLGLWGSLKR